MAPYVGLTPTLARRSSAHDLHIIKGILADGQDGFIWCHLSCHALLNADLIVSSASSASSRTNANGISRRTVGTYNDSWPKDQVRYI